MTATIHFTIIRMTNPYNLNHREVIGYDNPFCVRIISKPTDETTRIFTFRPPGQMTNPGAAEESAGVRRTPPET